MEVLHNKYIQRPISGCITTVVATPGGEIQDSNFVIAHCIHKMHKFLYYCAVKLQEHTAYMYPSGMMTVLSSNILQNKFTQLHISAI